MAFLGQLEVFFLSLAKIQILYYIGNQFIIKFYSFYDSPYIIGGNGEDAAKVVTGFPAFQDFIIKGGVYSKEIYGVPISFSGANAADNSMFISQIKI